MGDTSINVSEEAKARLDIHRREGETYGDVIMRLTEGNQWAGFGALSTDSDTRTGMKWTRERLRAGTNEDIQEYE